MTNIDSAAVSAVGPPAPGGEHLGEGTRGLLWSLTWSQFSLSIVFGAVPSVLLALQVEDAVGDDRKAGMLALLTTLGAVAAMIAHPVVGVLSDRTRSRWGSRTPWMLGGAAFSLPVLWGMGLTDRLWLLGILYVLSEVGLAASQGPLMAVLPDRVATRVRGRYSAALGMGVMIGTVAGQGVAALLSDHLLTAYVVLGLLPLALTAMRVFADPDPDNRQAVLHPTDVRAILRSYRLSPRAYPDFWWAFASRLFTYTGFFVVYGYSLYILDDYVGLGDDAVDKVPLFAGLAALSICVTTIPSGAISDRIGRRKLFVLISSVGMGVGFLVPLLTRDLWGILVMAVIAGLAFGCYQAVDSALITEVLPRAASFAQDLGIVNVASILPQVLAPAIAGAIVVGTGGYVVLFPAAAVLAALGGLTVLRVRGVR